MNAVASSKKIQIVGILYCFFVITVALRRKPHRKGTPIQIKSTQQFLHLPQKDINLPAWISRMKFIAKRNKKTKRNICGIQDNWWSKTFLKNIQGGK